MLMVLAAGVYGAVETDGYLSPATMAVDQNRGVLYICEETGNAVAVYDAKQGKILGTLKLPGTPGGIALDPEGKYCYVTEAVPEGKVYRFATANGKEAGTYPAGHTPVAPLISPDGKTLYVCNRFDNTVSVIDLGTCKHKATVSVAREPIGLCITPDGRYVFAANHLPAGAADRDYVSAVVSVIDTVSNAVVNTIILPNGSTGVRGIAISPDGRHVYVTHIVARYQVPTTQLERGWMNTSGLSVIDAQTLEYINTVLLDDVDLGAANPWGVTVTPDGTNIVVTHAGTHEISIIDRTALHARLDRVARGEAVTSVSTSADDVPNDLSFLVGLRQRIPLKGNGPRGVVVYGSNIYASEYFSDSLSILPLHNPRRNTVRQAALGPAKALDIKRRGEMLFNDATMCFQQWQSCASCHPDARTDGLNWDLLNDGLGNPKQTKSMLLTHQTPPVMVTGIRPDAATAVRSGMKYIQFVVRPEADAVALDTYLQSLQPVPSPYLQKGKMSTAACRGEELFKKARCASCHSGPLYTDLKTYDIGLGIGNEKDREFDTPSLVEIWRTAPYLYDGRANTVKELLAKNNPDNTHGATQGLTPEELTDLSEYILSL